MTSCNYWCLESLPFQATWLCTCKEGGTQVQLPPLICWSCAHA